jgi:hypothetical protein
VSNHIRRSNRKRVRSRVNGTVVYTEVGVADGS